MAFALISNAAAGSSGAGFPSAVTTGAINTTGAKLIIMSRVDYSNTDIAVQDSAGNTWINAINYQPSSLINIAVYYCVNPIISATHTFTTPNDGNGTFPSIAAAAFSGAPLATPTDQQSTNQSASAASLQPGSITPTKANSLIYGCAGSLSTSTTITGLTLLNDVPFVTNQKVGFTHGYAIQTNAAAINPTFNFNTTNLCSAVQLNFLINPAGAIYATPWFG